MGAHCQEVGETATYPSGAGEAEGGLDPSALNDIMNRIWTGVPDECRVSHGIVWTGVPDECRVSLGGFERPLQELNNSDLREAGIVKMGHRKRVLKNIADIIAGAT